MLRKPNKYKIAKWMIEKEGGIQKIPSKAVTDFPQFFQGTQNAKIYISGHELLERSTEYLAKL